MVVELWMHAHTSIGSVDIGSAKVVAQSLHAQANKSLPYAITHPPLLPWGIVMSSMPMDPFLSSDQGHYDHVLHGQSGP